MTLASCTETANESDTQTHMPETDVTADVAPPDSSKFHDYECTQDCSGHEAGYNWAETHDIDDEDDCSGNSNLFIEGCKAYVQEKADDSKVDTER